ncbi:MAG: hypothetical protein NPMRTH1_1250021 [Nitrosopumilales archaeon]|nr:MAG: hypothetical protein NPMRTH1_1250021 [Nitrosopumilales archaeon]
MGKITIDNLGRLSDITLYDQYEKIGWWWLPNCEDKHVCGKIIYNKGRISLETMFSMTGKDTGFLDNLDLQKIPVIFGTLDTGENIRLIDCRMHHRTNNKCEHRVLKMFSNARWNSPPEKFNKLSVEYSSLFEWLGIKTIDVQHDEEKNIITHTAPKSIPVKLDNENELNFFIGYSISHHYLPKNYIIPQFASVTLTHNKQISFEILYEKLKYFRYFLMLAVQNPVYPIKIHARVDNELEAVFLDQELDQDKKDIDNQNMLFTFQQIKDNHEKIIQTWYELCAKYDKSLMIFFSNMFHSKFLTLELQFLQMAQSLEAFHRVDNKKDIHLKDRLNELLLPYQDHFINFDTAKIEKSRHYYSHGFIEDYNESEILDIQNLYFSTMRMDRLIQICLLDKLPLNQELKNNIITKLMSDVDKTEILNQKIK